MLHLLSQQRRAVANTGVSDELRSRNSSSLSCKLSIDGIRSLVRLARASEHEERRAFQDPRQPQDFGDESKLDQSGFNGFPRGEP